MTNPSDIEGWPASFRHQALADSGDRARRHYRRVPSKRDRTGSRGGRAPRSSVKRISRRRPPDPTFTCYQPQFSAANVQFPTATPEPELAVWNPPKPAASLKNGGVAVQSAPEAEDLEAEREERLAIQKEPSIDGNTSI